MRSIALALVCLFPSVVLGEISDGLGPTPQLLPKAAAPQKLSSDMPPTELSTSLGQLVSGIFAYFPMDNKETGGLLWSQKPINPTASGAVQLKKEAGRTYFDFSQNGAVIELKPAVELPHHYTIAAWVQTPTPQNHGVIWHGTGGLLLGVQANSIFYFVPTQEAKYGEFAAPLSGWYHMAVEFDGQKTSAFLNGKMVGAPKAAVSKNLLSIGNHPSGEHQHWMMAAGIDEMYIFSRNLRPEELVALARLGKPAEAK